MPSTQLDYTLSGFTFSGLDVPTAVLHIQNVQFNDQGNAIVNVQIFASLAAMTTHPPLTVAQWAYTTSNGQTMAQVWASLQAMTGLMDLNGNIINLSGATPVAGE